MIPYVIVLIHNSNLQNEPNFYIYRPVFPKTASRWQQVAESFIQTISSKQLICLGMKQLTASNFFFLCLSESLIRLICSKTD